MLAVRRLRDLTLDAPRGEDRGHFLGAGSGLVRTGDYLYVIADDERELAVFPAEGHEPGRLERVLAGELSADPEQRKHDKPDLEALALVPAGPGHEVASLLALGSGSAPQRHLGVCWTLDSHGALGGEPRTIDLSSLYRKLGAELPSLNIEGATVWRDYLLLLQRGNAKGGVNARILCDLDQVVADLAGSRITSASVRDVRRYDLGHVADVRLCFSDATSLPDGRVVFTAVAEGGEGADGAFAGAAVGVLDPDGNVTGMRQVDPPFKIEGIEAHPADGGYALLMVADADDPAQPTPLLTAML